MQGGIQRAVLHLQHVLRSTLNMFRDLMAMSGAEEDREQNEHIERALQECRLFDSVSGLHDRSHSTVRMVDARPSVTLAELEVALAGMRVSVSVREQQSHCSRVTGNSDVTRLGKGCRPFRTCSYHTIQTGELMKISQYYAVGKFSSALSGRGIRSTSAFSRTGD